MIKLLDNGTIAFSNGGKTKIISEHDSIELLEAGDPMARLELIAWGMLAAYREHAKKIEAKMAEAVSHTPNVEDVLSLVTTRLPEILKSLGGENPATHVQVRPGNAGTVPQVVPDVT